LAQIARQMRDSGVAQKYMWEVYRFAPHARTALLSPGGEKLIYQKITKLFVKLSCVLFWIDSLGVVVHDVGFFLDWIEIDVADESVLPAHVSYESDASIFVGEETSSRLLSG
jgi:hypothetical protein